MAKEFVEAILHNSGYGEFPYYTAVPSIDEPQGFMNHVVFNGLVRYHKVTQDERVAKAIVQAADRIVNDVPLNSGEFIPMGLEVLGYAFQLTGDERYVNHGSRLLEARSIGSSWGKGLAQSRKGTPSFLGVLEKSAPVIINTEPFSLNLVGDKTERITVKITNVNDNKIVSNVAWVDVPDGLEIIPEKTQVAIEPDDTTEINCEARVVSDAAYGETRTLLTQCLSLEVTHPEGARHFTVPMTARPVQTTFRIPLNAETAEYQVELEKGGKYAVCLHFLGEGDISVGIDDVCYFDSATQKLTTAPEHSQFPQTGFWGVIPISIPLIEGSHKVDVTSRGELNADCLLITEIDFPALLITGDETLFIGGDAEQDVMITVCNVSENALKCSLTWRDLPPGVTVEEPRVEFTLQSGKNKIACFKTAADLATGEHTVCIDLECNGERKTYRIPMQTIAATEKIEITGAYPTLLAYGDHARVENPPCPPLPKGDTASVGAYLLLNHNKANGYDFLVGRAGEYVLWTRVKYPKDKPQEFYAMVDNQDDKTLMGGEEIYEQWHWVKGPTYDLSVGAHQVWIQDCNGNLMLDQLLLKRQEG